MLKNFAKSLIPILLITLINIKCNNPNQPSRVAPITLEALVPTWLEQRKKEQLEAAKTYEIYHNFSFVNKIADSKITFKHKINPDCGKSFKAVHYDHGNGIALADVDGDGQSDIYFVSQVGHGELWRNLGNGQFEDITRQAGLKVTGNKSCVSASFADIDNDGDPDLYITTIRDGNYLFENNGKGVFEDISEKSRTNHRGHSSGSIMFDYNLDGLIDIFVSNIGIYTRDSIQTFTRNGQSYQYYVGLDNAFVAHVLPEAQERSILYKNLGNNQFEEVAESLGIIDTSWSGDATILDANEDGYPDLYVCNMQGPDEYYENIKGEKFIKKSRTVFPKSSWGAMGVKVFDFNNDGKQDVYVTDMHSDMYNNWSLGAKEEKLKLDIDRPNSIFRGGSQNIYGNSFYLKEANNQYTEVSDSINAENYWPWGLSIGDFNADGFEDAFVTASMNYRYRYQVNSFLLNNKGKHFLDSEFVVGIEPRLDTQFAKLWFELDCSGIDKNHKDCRDRKGKVKVWGALGSRSSAILDIDNDGDLDILTNEFNDHPLVLISNLSEQRKDFKFLKIQLNGTVSNKNGIGAKVVVHTDHGSYTKIHDGKSGYLSQSILPLYFGLGKAKEIIKIEIQWPSGKSQIIQNNLVFNQLMKIQEPI